VGPSERLGLERRNAHHHAAKAEAAMMRPRGRSNGLTGAEHPPAYAWAARLQIAVLHANLLDTFDDDGERRGVVQILLRFP
jgi:hypothetical protein